MPETDETDDVEVRPVTWRPNEPAPAGKDARPLDADGNPIVDENVTPLPELRPGQKTLIGRLRKGMYIQQSHDSNDPDAFIQGPARIPLTKKIAIAHLTKFENVNEIKTWIADNWPAELEKRPWLRPLSARRMTPGDRMNKMVKDASEINQARQGRRDDAPAGLSRGEVQSMIDRSIQPVSRGIDELLRRLDARPPAAVPAPARTTPVREGSTADLSDETAPPPSSSDARSSRKAGRHAHRKGGRFARP